MIFDWTVSLGSLIAAAAVVVGIAAAAWRNGLIMKIGLIRLEALEARTVRIESKVEDIKVMQQQLADGKERMDSLDERVRNLERAK